MHPQSGSQQEFCLDISNQGPSWTLLPPSQLSSPAMLPVSHRQFRHVIQPHVFKPAFCPDCLSVMSLTSAKEVSLTFAPIGYKSFLFKLSHLGIYTRCPPSTLSLSLIHVSVSDISRGVCKIFNTTRFPRCGCGYPTCVKEILKILPPDTQIWILWRISSG